MGLAATVMVLSSEEELEELLEEQPVKVKVARSTAARHAPRTTRGFFFTRECAINSSFPVFSTHNVRGHE